jgi:hypothetical protein
MILRRWVTGTTSLWPTIYLTVKITTADLNHAVASAVPAASF